MTDGMLASGSERWIERVLWPVVGTLALTLRWSVTKAREFRSHWRTFLIMCGAQVLMYALLTYNIRVISQAKVRESLISDFFIANLSFGLIRWIAKENEAFWPRNGYVLGGLIGTYLGIMISCWK